MINYKHNSINPWLILQLQSPDPGCLKYIVHPVNLQQGGGGGGGAGGGPNNEAKNSKK